MTHCHRHTAAGLLVTKAVDGRTAGTAAPRVRVRCGVLSWSLAATFGHGYALCACATPVRRSTPARGDYGAGLQSLGRAMQPHGRWAAASRAQFERGARLQLRGARVTMRALWRLVTERMRSGCQRPRASAFSACVPAYGFNDTRPRRFRLHRLPARSHSQCRRPASTDSLHRICVREHPRRTHEPHARTCSPGGGTSHCERGEPRRWSSSRLKRNASTVGLTSASTDQSKGMRSPVLTSEGGLSLSKKPGSV